MRAIIAVLDSFGIGEAPDAAVFGDQGSNTFCHIAQACADGAADQPGLRQGPLNIPNLLALGLGHAARTAGGTLPAHMILPSTTTGLHGAAAERSKGKDTPSGHWEMMGLPVLFDWGYFPKETPCFPDQLINDLISRANIPGVLGNCHASGTSIIAELGEEHIKTGKPIVYTSADSVFQIAAHETHFGLDRLYELCAIARELVDDYHIGRVIARPFLGEHPDTFERTGNRRDLATPPHAPTLLDISKDHGREVISIGKISDIFAGSGISRSIKAHGNQAVFERLIEQIETASDGSIVFANFVDFDMLYGHRRNVPGYAAALEAFDRQLPALRAALKPGDVMVLSADHGCDPTAEGSDHTREYIPVLAFGPDLGAKDIGIRQSFADIGQSLAHHLGLPPLDAGERFF
ncbi:phosphopentomutase [Iodidimonas nitroreducens]|uniref:Phosphopentomutase n=1 Tax=Iodidimonas nitroreducens TaxID=1236968 RepID=A0A5A7NCD7_9PROT|nr:phosphopentomutase [Iodidimonas nitroreducens]GAK33396.1 phosphopentomutase [alpha proteobacterium Q-1]GER04636.1 phosphopentomutase [Iodidimonas nitroreducens]